MRSCVFLAMWLAAAGAIAGGSNYGVAPGTRDFAGKVSEWPVPTPKFARDPAPGPDGNIYITVMFADRIARFDTKTHQFKEWDLPSGAHPHGLLVDSSGKVWYTGNGKGVIGELDPATGKVIEHRPPSGGNPLDGRGTPPSRATSWHGLGARVRNGHQPEGRAAQRFETPRIEPEDNRAKSGHHVDDHRQVER